MRLFLISVIGLFVLAGCRIRQVPVLGWLLGGEESAPPGSNSGGSGGSQPFDWIGTIAGLGTAVSAAAFIACPFVFAFFPGVRSLVPRVLVAAIATFVACQILIWVGDHLAWLAGLTLVVGIAAACFRWRKKIADGVECVGGNPSDGNTVCGVEKNRDHA